MEYRTTWRVEVYPHEGDGRGNATDAFQDALDAFDDIPVSITAHFDTLTETATEASMQWSVEFDHEGDDPSASHGDILNLTDDVPAAIYPTYAFSLAAS